MKKAYLLSFGFIMGIALFLNSCNDKDPKPAPTITGIDPASGKFNTSIVISGTDFEGSSLSVKINDKPVVITASTATQLTVTIPKGAGTGKVTVSNDGGSVDGPVFTYIPTVTVTTLAGDGTAGFLDATGPGAKFNRPAGLTFDNSGNLYVCDRSNNRIRKITPEGVTTTFFGPTIPVGNNVFRIFSTPSGIAFDGVSNFYVAVAGLSNVVKLNSSGVSLLAGDIQGFADGTGLQAMFDFPTSLVVDKQGNIIVADFVNKRIRRVTPEGVVTTIAGDGSMDFVSGNGIAARIGSVWGLTQDSQSNFYFSTFDTYRILKMNPAGDVTSYAGDGTLGFC
jgi:IPT/TIG domain/NHL repeat